MDIPSWFSAGISVLAIGIASATYLTRKRWRDEDKLEKSLAEIKTNINTLRTDIDTNINTLRTDIDTKFNTLNERINERATRVDAEFMKLHGEIGQLQGGAHTHDS